MVAGSVLIASTVVTVLFRHDMGEARARLAAQSTEIFQSSYGDIQYRVSGDGPPVLVLHGITGGVDQAEAMVTQWRNLRPDHRLTYVSRFGYLQSAMPHDATVRMQAAAYRELPDHLGVDRVFVVGNSAGGPSAMWFAIDFPERINGRILISSAVPGPLPGPIPPLVAKHERPTLSSDLGGAVLVAAHERKPGPWINELSGLAAVALGSAHWVFAPHEHGLAKRPGAKSARGACHKPVSGHGPPRCGRLRAPAGRLE